LETTGKQFMVIEDSRMPTERERQELCRMLFWALLEIRGAGLRGEAQRAGDLADAFHELPTYLWSDEFSFSFFRLFLESYQQKYAEAGGFNFLAMLDNIIEGKVLIGNDNSQSKN
jgi:hypothetical protein